MVDYTFDGTRLNIVTKMIYTYTEGIYLKNMYAPPNVPSL